jgi:hypothetical protein
MKIASRAVVLVLLVAVQAPAAPPQLPEKVVADWKKAGSRTGWMRPEPHGGYFGFKPAKGSKDDYLPAFCPDGKAALPSALPDPGKPFGLRLSFNKHLTDDSLKNLAHLKSLRVLVLDNTNVTGAGMKHLAGLKNLQALYLRHTKTTATGLKELVPLEKLRLLDLYATEMDDAGLAELAKIKSLHWVRLGWAKKVTDAGVKNLAALPELRWLDLSDTSVTGDSLKDLAKLEKLESLDLSSTPVRDESLKALCRAKSLQELRLQGTAITDAGLKHVAGMKGLRKLDLSGTTGITEKGRAELKRPCRGARSTSNPTCSSVVILDIDTRLKNLLNQVRCLVGKPAAQPEPLYPLQQR